MVTPTCVSFVQKLHCYSGNFISEIKGDTRKLVYHALVGLLQDNDIAIRVQVLNFISVLLEHVGDKVIPFASQLSQFFQKIWDESAGENLLQIQLLAALRTFVSSLGYQSPLSYHMLIPILQSGINVDSPDALNLLEDSVLIWDESAGESLLQIQLLAAFITFVSSLGYQSPLSYHMLIPILQSGINVDSPDALNLLDDSVLLWEVALSNAPSIVPQLLDLFPYLVGIMNRSFDHVENSQNDGVIRMKPRDPRRMLHNNIAQKIEAGNSVQMVAVIYAFV